jgi:putative CRISPR-associated protein (TIGR02619 family)
MSRPRLIVSTCGTSIFTNNTDKKIRDILNKYTNASYNDIPTQDRDIIENHIRNRTQEINQVQNLRQISNMSAELNGIIKIYNNNLPKNNTRDIHCLIHSDTYLGEKAAEIVCNWLKTKFKSVDPYPIKYLKTDKIENFRSAISELVKFCYEVIKGYKENNYYVIFNLTGGFKSVQGIMQTFGMFYADECVYIFETGQELLRIPKLPVKLEVEESIRKHLIKFRKLSLGETLNRDECRGIPEVYLFIINDQVTLSGWGELVWNEVKDKIYSETLLLSPHPKIIYSKQFIDVVNKLSPDRKKIINRRIDQLYRYIITNRQENPESLNFHSLNVPSGNSTCEFYAWSDRDAARVYCHWENEKIVIDGIGEHL